MLPDREAPSGTQFDVFGLGSLHTRGGGGYAGEGDFYNDGLRGVQPSHLLGDRSVAPGEQVETLGPQGVDRPPSGGIPRWLLYVAAGVALYLVVKE